MDCLYGQGSTLSTIKSKSGVSLINIDKDIKVAVLAHVSFLCSDTVLRCATGATAGESDACGAL